MSKVDGSLRQRTCISCKRIKDKNAMLRFVKDPEGNVHVDVVGNSPGRGAYVCSSKCLEVALGKKLVGRGLRTKFSNKLDDDEKKAVEEFFSKMGKESCEE